MFDLMVRDELALDPALVAWLERAAEHVLEVAGCEPEAEASWVLTDDAEIRELNLEWRGLDEPTDVLSFALQESEDAELTPWLLGDVVVSVETAARMVSRGEHRDRVCAELGRDLPWGLREELLFLAVHGVLHLLGHDHAEPDEEREMREAERTVFFGVLERLGTA